MIAHMVDSVAGIREKVVIPQADGIFWAIAVHVRPAPPADISYFWRGDHMLLFMEQNLPDVGHGAVVASRAFDGVHKGFFKLLIF
jgi:hypothetical protein